MHGRAILQRLPLPDLAIPHGKEPREEGQERPGKTLPRCGFAPRIDKVSPRRGMTHDYRSPLLFGTRAGDGNVSTTAQDATADDSHRYVFIPRPAATPIGNNPACFTTAACKAI